MAGSGPEIVILFLAGRDGEATLTSCTGAWSAGVALSAEMCAACWKFVGAEITNLKRDGSWIVRDQPALHHDLLVYASLYRSTALL